MDIGAFIEEHRSMLDSWGNFIVQQIAPIAQSRLKVAPAFRVKDPISARVKQIRKGYANPAEQMTDLVGARFVVLTEDDLTPLRVFIESSSDWFSVKSRDPLFERDDDPTAFAYQSYHYELRPTDRAIEVQSNLEPWACCEVQVRTLLQHAYAELTHDSMYKPVQTVPSRAERLVARSMALMETTDELLSRALAAVRDANAPAHALAESAKVTTGADLSAEGQVLFDILAQEFTDLIGTGAADSLTQLVASKPFLLDRISSRDSRGIFQFPVVAITSYWVASILENRARVRWPFAGSHDDLALMLSDLGLGSDMA